MFDYAPEKQNRRQYEWPETKGTSTTPRRPEKMEGGGPAENAGMPARMPNPARSGATPPKFV